MANYVVGLVMVLYATAGILYMVDGKLGLGIAYCCYALANVGLIMAAKGM